MRPPSFTFSVPNLPKSLWVWLRLTKEQTGATYRELVCLALADLIAREKQGDVDLVDRLRAWRSTHED